MTIPFSRVARIPEGNLTASFTYNTGAGYFYVYWKRTLLIQCWGKGGKGANGVNLSLGGGGGGGGGYCRNALVVNRGTVFHWSIDADGDCHVTSSLYGMHMIANHGNDGGGSTGGSGGTASGGDVNSTGQSGFSTLTTTGGRGGRATNGGIGGAGGTFGNNGKAGATPGGGGGGGGAGLPPAAGGSGGQPQIKFSWIYVGIPGGPIDPDE